MMKSGTVAVVGKANAGKSTLINRFSGGPVGLETLSSAIGEEIRNIEEVYEPYLIKLGFVNKTPRGRMATEKAYKSLGISYNYGFFKED